MSIPFIPPSAPFNDEQRAWLNGFFAGLLGSMENGSPKTQSAITTAVATAPTIKEEEFPWHDDSLTLDERLAFAEGKPVERRLMAAMAQLDCGSCGYVCQTYAEAIARGEDSDLTKCSPGGSETAKALRKIFEVEALLESVPPNNPPAPNSPASNAPNTFSRQHPYRAKLIESRRITHDSSPKDTRHIAIDIAGSGINYEPGDSLGILPQNCPELVDGIIDRLGVNADQLVPSVMNGDIPIREALLKNWTISRLRKPIVEFVASHCHDPSETEKLLEWTKQEEEGYGAVDLLHLLEHAPSAILDPRHLIEKLAKLQPRLYSISSSPLAHPGEVHLTVGVAAYEAAGAKRLGVASGYLGKRSSMGDELDIFIQPSHKFRLPTDESTPIIMVGPGTGIAPFRAFLEHREVRGAKGKNWLLFGNTSVKQDFLYQSELESFVERGSLHRLDVAFSRDQADKIYVQHRMLEQGQALWQWLEEGAYFYVCGDAKRMAVDVDAALTKIVAKHGCRSEEQAKEYIKGLSKAKRYLKDVY